MTADEIRADKALCEAATEKPWRAATSWRRGLELPPMVWDASGDAIVNLMPDGTPYLEPEDAAFIAAARTRWPAYIAEVARLRAAIVILDNEKLDVQCERDGKDVEAEFFERENATLRAVVEWSPALGRIIPLCDRCGHNATSHEVDDELRGRCMEVSCTCAEFAMPPERAARAEGGS